MNIEQKKIKSPFTVPEGYFGDLEGNILSEIKVQSLKKLTNLKTPKGYFDDLENNILAEIKLDNLKNINLSKTPDNYFDKLESNILSQIKIDQIKKIDKLNTPEDYFEDLEKNILSSVKIDSLRKVGKLDTPENYFEALESKILSKTLVQEKKTTFSVFKNKVVYFRNAAAIILIGTMSVLVYKNQTKDQFEEISSDEMVAYLSEQTITESELTNIVDESTLQGVNVIPSNAGLSEIELQKYLEENGI